MALLLNLAFLLEICILFFKNVGFAKTTSALLCIKRMEMLLTHITPNGVKSWV